MSEAPVRPLFLTVLCFLTFMSSVSGLWMQSERLWSPEIVAEQTREVFETARGTMKSKTAPEDSQAFDTVFNSVISETTANSIRTSAIILIIFESIAMYAAYLIWNLQKRGYYLYLIGMAFAFLAPLVLIGGWFGVTTAFAGVLSSILMAILYTLNRKYLY